MDVRDLIFYLKNILAIGRLAEKDIFQNFLSHILKIPFLLVFFPSSKNLRGLEIFEKVYIT